MKFINIKEWEGFNLIRPNLAFSQFVQYSISYFFEFIEKNFYKKNIRKLYCSSFLDFNNNDFVISNTKCNCKNSNKIILENTLICIFRIFLKNYLKKKNRYLEEKFIVSKKFLEK